MINEIIKKISSFFKKQEIEKKDSIFNEKAETENTQDKKDKPPDDIYPLW